MTSTEIVAPEKRPANGTAIAALIFVILSYVAPIAIVIVGVAIANDYVPNESALPDVFVGGFIALFVGAIVAILLDFFGLILGVVALFRKNRGKVLAVVAIVLGLIPLGVSIGLFALFGSSSPFAG